MDNHPTQNYNVLAAAIIVAAAILGAAILGSSMAHATVTSISTENSTATSFLTDTLMQTATVTQATSSTITTIIMSTTAVTSTVTSTAISPPPATSTLVVDSINQNGQKITGHYTMLGGPVGSLVIGEGATPTKLTTTVGQTYFVRAESNGSCTFNGWSDGGTNDPRSFNATSDPVSYTAVYNCSNTSATSPILQSCTGYFPTIANVTQTLVQSSTSTQAATTTVTTTGPGPRPTTQTISCTMSSNIRAGDLIIVKISDLPRTNFSDSMGNSFALLEMDPASSTYYNLIYYSIASSSGPDTFTVRGYGNYPSIMAIELQGLHTISSYEVASGNSSVASVSAFTPPSGSFVMALVEPLGPPISVSAGPGYTMAAVYAVSNACEYSTVTGQTTSSFSLGAPADWEEVSLVLSQ